MRRVDLNQVRAEVNDEPIEATIGDRTFKVRAMLPWDVAALWRDDKLDEAISALTVDPAEGAAFARAVLYDRPDKVTAAARVNAIYAAADDLVGEAQASSES